MESCAINSFDVDLELGSVSLLSFCLLHFCIFRFELLQKYLLRMLLLDWWFVTYLGL